jgi:hypothetical protein
MTEIFADGISSIAISNGVARIELVQMRKTTVGEARLVPETTATLLVPINGLQQMTQQLAQSLKQLQEQTAARGQKIGSGDETAKEEASAEDALTNL